MKEKTHMNFSAAMTLALIALTSWDEDDKRDPQRRFTRAWKNYEMDILQSLEKRGYVRASMKTNSLHVTDAGLREGRILVKYMKAAFEDYIANDEMLGKIKLPDEIAKQE